MKKILIALIIFIFQHGFSQEFLFPQNVQYPFGYMSKNITSDDAQKAYEAWKLAFVKNCGENEAKIIKDLNGVETTVSEGIGYGLLIVAYAGDKVLFDKLLNYYCARKNKHGMMNWIYKNCDSGDNGKNGATDADLDAALALVVAYKQWPKEKQYKKEASMLIDSLQKYNFIICDSLIVQKPGDDFGGCNCTNPSYYSPAYYRVFAQFKVEEKNKKAAEFWIKAAEDSYIVLLRNANPYTGLVFAWTNSNGKDPSDCYYEVSGSGTYNSYQYDACRTPWRISMDYIWWGNTQAQNWCNTITNFVNTPVYIHKIENGDVWYGAGGISNIVDGYWSNGLRRIEEKGQTYGHRHTIPFVGAFALAAMCTNQQNTDTFMTEFNSIKATRYFESCLGVIYKFMATGNMWNPYPISSEKK